MLSGAVFMGHLMGGCHRGGRHEPKELGDVFYRGRGAESPVSHILRPQSTMSQTSRPLSNVDSTDPCTPAF